MTPPDENEPLTERGQGREGDCTGCALTALGFILVSTAGLLWGIWQAAAAAH